MRPLTLLALIIILSGCLGGQKDEKDCGTEDCMLERAISYRNQIMGDEMLAELSKEKGCGSGDERSRCEAKIMKASLETVRDRAACKKIKTTKIRDRCYSETYECKPILSASVKKECENTLYPTDITASGCARIIAPPLSELDEQMADGRISASIIPSMEYESLAAESKKGPCNVRPSKMAGDGMPLVIDCPPQQRFKDGWVTISLSYIEGGSEVSEECRLARDVEKLWWV